MSDLPMLPVSKMRALRPYFPKTRGLKRVDDRRVLSGIVYVIRHGLQWKDAPSGYGPHKTLYNRFIRWSRLGVFARIFSALTGNAGVPEELMIDSTHLKAHRTAASLLKKGVPARRIGRTRGGLNSKLHAVCDGHGRPVAMLLTEGQMSDHKGAALLLPRLPSARHLVGDRGYDSNCFRRNLTERGIEPCIPSTKSRKVPIPHDKSRYRRRHKVENMFGRLKDWRRIATRYDRCAHTFFSAICLAATVIYWTP
ncbi:IS5 family transposase [Swaminathania salitolerans]|uniref:IS5 family transposase n=1 Tax=Swaminathania salitolerans TaxID=182838 RepID=UPI001FEAF453|nr:IS5 family transposase [Swaminathania salitolerans]